VASEVVEHHDADAGVTRRERAVLLVSVLVISICALVYELLIGTLSSYLLGDSVTQFSITIGLFLFAMGVGALLSRQIRRDELRWFVMVELLTGLFGGLAAAILYAVFTTHSAYYYVVMISVIMAIGICIGLEIPLLTRIVANRASLSRALADVLSIDYLGALVGSLAFPLLLLPALGVNQTGFFIGLLNITVAALILYMFQGRIGKAAARGLWAATIALIALMIGGFALSGGFVRYFEQRLYQDLIVYSEQTQYQRLIVTRSGQDTRLYLDGNLQLSSRDEYRYHEMLVHPVMSAARSRETVLILGGGDGIVAREVLKYDDVEQVVLVDLDPAMTRLAQSYAPLREMNGDALNDARVEIITTDAYRFIDESDALFSVVIIDLPDPSNESLSKLYSREFYTLLRGRLTPDGVFVTQATSPYFVREAFWMIAHTIGDAGFHTLPLRTYVPSFGEWGFVIGAPLRISTLSVPGDIRLRYLTADVLAAAQTFDPDIAEIETAINTLNNPVLPRAYARGWDLWD
jgi:spermidine synthase